MPGDHKKGGGVGAGAPPSVIDLDQMFRERRGPLLGFLIARTGRPEEAEEILQETFIRFQKRYGEADVASPEALLARIASNLLIDRVRQRRSRENREKEWGEAHLADDAHTDFSGRSAATQERSLEAKQEVERALEILRSLPVGVRQVFLLHRLEGYTHPEIAARLGIGKSTVEKRMMRAIKALAGMKAD